MIKGKIYKANCSIRNLKGHIHPIIVLDINEEDNTFIGAIISHESGYGNKTLSPNHFKSDREYTILFDPNNPSYLVYKKLIKLKVDINAKAFGELTCEGFEHVNNTLKNVTPEVLDKPIWENNMDNPENAVLVLPHEG